MYLARGPSPGSGENHGMWPSFKILYLFASSNAWLTEVKRLGLAADLPKDQVYQWAWISAARVTPLRFVSMATEPRQQREFEDASLWFDTKQGILTWHDGIEVTLEVQAVHKLPPLQEHLLETHFSRA